MTVLTAASQQKPCLYYKYVSTDDLRLLLRQPLTFSNPVNVNKKNRIGYLKPTVAKEINKKPSLQPLKIYILNLLASISISQVFTAVLSTTIVIVETGRELQ